MPTAKSIFSVDVQLSVAFFHVKYLSLSDDLRIIPPSSTAISFPTTPLSSIPNSIFLSSTCKLITPILVWVPLTVRFPEMFTSPPTSSVFVGVP